MLHILYTAILFLFWRVFLRISYQCPPHLDFTMDLMDWSEVVTLSHDCVRWLSIGNNDRVRCFLFSAGPVRRLLTSWAFFDLFFFVTPGARLVVLNELRNDQHRSRPVPHLGEKEGSDRSRVAEGSPRPRQEVGGELSLFLPSPRVSQ